MTLLQHSPSDTNPSETHAANASAGKLDFAVIVPVLNEVGNIAPLLQRIIAALPPVSWELIFVDDGSTDGTIAEIERAAQCDRRIRVIRRIGRRGLSSAVMEGFLSTIAPIVAAMDGDMQHDETILSRLYTAIYDGDAEIAVGTRYANGGSVEGWSPARRTISQIATKLASPLIKTTLHDPMSGFFAIRRDVAIEAAPRLSAVGYKLLLDIVASLPREARVREVPYHFRNRISGESKLDSAVVLEYIELVLDKLFGRIVPPKLVLFGAVGTCGVLVHLGILNALLNGLGVTFSIAQTGATVGAMTFNYALNNEMTYRDRRLRGLKWLGGWASFCTACGIGAIANVGLGAKLYGGEWSWWAAGLAGAAIGSIWNYVATSWVTWRAK